jgi:gamma-tubulin complex component 2
MGAWPYTQELLHDWHTMVVQLEHQRNLGRLSLQAAWFYCQPAVAAMELLAAVAAKAPSLRGRDTSSN